VKGAGAGGSTWQLRRGSRQTACANAGKARTFGLLDGFAGKLRAPGLLEGFAQVTNGHRVATEKVLTRVSKPLDQLINAPSCKDTCAPGTTRTCDLGIRRPLLYPPELRRQCAGQSIEQRVRIRLGDATRDEKSSAAPNIGYGVTLDTRTTLAGNQPLTATMRVPDVEG
jgi:hypothetical protein